MPYKNPEQQKAYQREWNRGKKFKVIRRRYRESLKELIRSLRTQCVRCGETDRRCLDFHHRDPSTKIECVSNMWRFYGREMILEEIAKCDLLCANCHRKHHG